MYVVGFAFMVEIVTLVITCACPKRILSGEPLDINMQTPPSAAPETFEF